MCVSVCGFVCVCVCVRVCGVFLWYVYVGMCVSLHFMLHIHTFNVQKQNEHLTIYWITTISIPLLFNTFVMVWYSIVHNSVVFISSQITIKI